MMVWGPHRGPPCPRLWGGEPGRTAEPPERPAGRGAGGGRAVRGKRGPERSGRKKTAGGLCIGCQLVLNIQGRLLLLLTDRPHSCWVCLLPATPEGCIEPRPKNTQSSSHAHSLAPAHTSGWAEPLSFSPASPACWCLPAVPLAPVQTPQPEMPFHSAAALSLTHRACSCPCLTPPQHKPVCPTFIDLHKHLPDQFVSMAPRIWLVVFMPLPGLLGVYLELRQSL